MESVVFVTLLAAITVTLCSSAAVVPVGEGKILDSRAFLKISAAFDFAPQTCQSVFEVTSFSPQTGPSSAQFTRISASLTSCAPLHSGATFPLSKSIQERPCCDNSMNLCAFLWCIRCHVNFVILDAQKISFRIPRTANDFGVTE